MTPVTNPFMPSMTAGAYGKGWSEALGLWESGWRIWAAYMSDLSVAVTPEAVLQANCKLFANCMEAPGFAVGEMQRDTGLTAPTLNA